MKCLQVKKMWKAGLVSVMLAFAFGASGVKAADDVIKLSFATYYPGTAAWADLDIAYMKAIEKESNGRVVFDPINWKGLFGAKELQGAAADQAVDVIWSSSSYTPSVNKLRVLLLGGPFLSTTVASQSQCMNYMYETWAPARDDFHDNGVVVLYIRPGPEMMFMFNAPITGPEDMVGKKFRSVGEIIGNGLVNMGAVPVLVEAFDIEQQMRAGNIDGAVEMGGMAAVNQVANLGEGAQLVNPGIGPYGAGHMLMSKKTWDGLPADIQTMFNDFRFKWTNVAIQERYADFGVMMKTVEEQGLDYLEFTPAQSAQLFEMMKMTEELNNLTAKFDAEGIPASEALARHTACADIVDRVNPTPANGASDIHMSHVLGLSKGEPYEFNAAELSTNPLGL